MKAATPLFLLVIISGINCHPVLEEDESVNNGNWLDDEFLLDDAFSTSLLSPFDIGRFTPRLSPFLQPPTVDFQEVIVGSFPGDDDLLLSESEKYSKKPLPNAFVLQTPSRVIEPPTREFGANPKKPAVGDLYIPRYPSLESLRELLPESFWSQFSGDSPTSVSSIATDQQVPSESVSSEAASDDAQETEATSPKLEIDEPSLLLVPPTRAFQVEIPRILVPPTEEFTAAGSN